MNLADTIILSFGGQGSGCQGQNCGRPTLYHGTLHENVKGIMEKGLLKGKGEGYKKVWATEQKSEALRYAAFGTENKIREKMAGRSEREIKVALKKALVALIVMENPEKAGFDTDYYKVHESSKNISPKNISAIEIHKWADARRAVGRTKVTSVPIKVLKP